MPDQEALGLNPVAVEAVASEEREVEESKDSISHFLFDESLELGLRGVSEIARTCWFTATCEKPDLVRPLHQASDYLDERKVKGRPIFYNQGNLGVDLVRGLDSPPNAQNMTGTERSEQQRAYMQGENNSIAYVANTTYKNSRLVEIRIYPVDLGLGARPWSRENIPVTPTPDKARSILEKIQKYSEPFGTTISIENNIGVIRVPPEATVEVGGDLDIPGRRPQRK